MGADAVAVGADFSDARRYEVRRDGSGRRGMALGAGTDHLDARRLAEINRGGRFANDTVPPRMKSLYSIRREARFT